MYLALRKFQNDCKTLKTKADRTDRAISGLSGQLSVPE